MGAERGRPASNTDTNLVVPLIGIVIIVVMRKLTGRRTKINLDESKAGVIRFAQWRTCQLALARSLRSILASSKPTARAADSTVAPWPMRCSARSTLSSCW